MCEKCDDSIQRPVNRADFAVIFSELVFNIAQTFTAFFENFYELSIYHAKRKAAVNKVWDDFAQDLETLPEDTNGAS